MSSLTAPQCDEKKKNIKEMYTQSAPRRSFCNVHVFIYLFNEI